MTEYEKDGNVWREWKVCLSVGSLSPQAPTTFSHQVGTERDPLNNIQNNNILKQWKQTVKELRQAENKISLLF